MMPSLRPVRLAVYFDQVLHVGGGFQQGLNAALLTKELTTDLAETIFFSTRKENIDILHTFGISAIYFPLTFIRRIELVIHRAIQNHRLYRLWVKIAGKNACEKCMVKHGVDLVYFVSPNANASNLGEINYINTVWDLCHRDDVEFPEVRTGREFEQRERLYRSTLPKAVAILVDSTIGKNNVIRRYGIDQERIHVMPFMPAMSVKITEEDYRNGYIDICERYQLTDPYVFYPAQFWAHKNHVYLLEGIKCLEMQLGRRVCAIFSGGDQGNLAYVRRISAELGLNDRVRFVGFVPNEEIPYLYRQSLALVMPTYFGPTNLPPLEAFTLGVPVLYPDKHGLRDQVGEAALLMDLNDPMSLAKHLADLYDNKWLREDLVKRGRAALTLSGQNQLEILTTILRDFQRRRACWD